MDRPLEEAIVFELLKLSPAERLSILGRVKNNGIFCPECGEGDYEHPNPHCRCWDDE